MKELDIESDFEQIKLMKKQDFKKLIANRIEKKAMKVLEQKKANHSNVLVSNKTRLEETRLVSKQVLQNSQVLFLHSQGTKECGQDSHPGKYQPGPEC